MSSPSSPSSSYMYSMETFTLHLQTINHGSERVLPVFRPSTLIYAALLLCRYFVPFIHQSFHALCISGVILVAASSCTGTNPYLKCNNKISQGTGAYRRSWFDHTKVDKARAARRFRTLHRAWLIDYLNTLHRPAVGSK